LVVAVDDGLYVRGYTRTDSHWYQAAVRQKGGGFIGRRRDKGGDLRCR